MAWGQYRRGGGVVCHNCCRVAGVISEKVRVTVYSLVSIVIITTTAAAITTTTAAATTTTTATTIWWQGLGQGQVFCFSTATRPAVGPIYIPVQWSPGAISPGIKQPGSEAGHFNLLVCIF